MTDLTSPHDPLPGGISRHDIAQMLDDGQNVAPELQEIFGEEAEEHLRTIYDGLDRLRVDGDDREALGNVRRASHTLKGAAGAVGVRAVTRLAHRMEDLLDILFDEQKTVTSEITILLLSTADRMQELTGENPNTASMVKAIADLFVEYAKHLSSENDTTASESGAAASAETTDSSADSDELDPSVAAELAALGFAEGDLGFDDEALSSGDDLAAAEAAMAAIQSGESVTVSGETSGVAETTNQAETTSQAEIATPETQAPAAKPAASKTAAQKPDAANAVTPKPAAETHIRVPLWRLDDMTRLVGEMIINRSAFAQRLNGFSTQIEDLQTALSRLRGVTHDVETQYSVDALRGGGDSSLGTFQSPFSRMAGGAAQESSTANGQGEHFDELEFDRYTEFHLLARTLAEATSDVGSIASECRALSGDFDALLGRWQRLTRDAQDRLMQIRMVPLRSLAPRLGRIARSTASQCKKSVHFVVRGDHTELDKTVLEEIADPLLHLIRNAVDHGIETPDERIAAGKEPQANLTIEAVNQGTQLTLRVEDDGRGLDIEKIREKAISRGLISPDQMIPTEELQMLIFAPGFSTASEVTDVSGRGVGMDVVRETVSRLGGTIRVDSVAGRGAKFLIILPTTLAVTRALIVSTGGASFAIPMQAISKISRLDPGAVSRLGNDRIIDIDGRTTRLADMAEQLALGPASDFKKPLPLLTIESGDRRAAVTVEAIEGGQDIVVKSLGDHLKSVHGLIGSTIRGDGSVIPILDPADLVGLIRDTPSDWSSSMPTQVATASRGKRHVMIVDDSVSVRRITSSVMRSGGWTVALAKDGVDALEQLHGDAGLPNIILLDMEMPRMDGLELLANLRGSDRMRDIPVVMVTSRAGDKHRKRAMEAGATEYLVKPFRDDQLLEIAGRLADSAKAAVPQMA